MTRSSRLHLLDRFIESARDAGETDNLLFRRAAVIIRKIKARDDPPDCDVWIEVADRLRDLDYDTGWMDSYDPTDDPRTHDPTPTPTPMAHTMTFKNGRPADCEHPDCDCPDGDCRASGGDNDNDNQGGDGTTG